MTKLKIPDSNARNFRSDDDRMTENSKNDLLHLQAERGVIIQNMKVVYEVGTQILKDLDVEIDDLRIRLRNS